MKNKNKKIAIVGTVGIPARYGGFETLAEHLVLLLDSKFDFTVYCSSKEYPSKRKNFLKARLVYLPLKANGISSIAYDAISIFHSLFYADVILILGVSAAFMIPLLRLFSSKRIIVNIDGLEWKRSKWSKLTQKFLLFQESIAVKYSHSVIADNKAIVDYVQNRYQVKAILISYGGSHVKKETISTAELKAFGLSEPYCFSVCRIEPENNIHLILEAFSQITIPLVLVGNYNSSKYGRRLKLRFEAHSNIHMLDPIYDQKKLNKLRNNCRLYIHGHKAGGTNPSLVEAMYLGLPIVAFDIDYNRYTTANLALYFKDVSGLKAHLNSFDMTTDLKKMGEKLKDLALKKYHWDQISSSYHVILNNESSEQ